MNNLFLFLTFASVIGVKVFALYLAYLVVQKESSTDTCSKVTTDSPSDDEVMMSEMPYAKESYSPDALSLMAAGMDTNDEPDYVADGEGPVGMYRDHLLSEAHKLDDRGARARAILNKSGHLFNSHSGITEKIYPTNTPVKYHAPIRSEEDEEPKDNVRSLAEAREKKLASSNFKHSS